MEQQNKIIDRVELNKIGVGLTIYLPKGIISHPKFPFKQGDKFIFVLDESNRIILTPIELISDKL